MGSGFVLEFEMGNERFLDFVSSSYCYCFLFILKWKCVYDTRIAPSRPMALASGLKLKIQPRVGGVKRLFGPEEGPQGLKLGHRPTKSSVSTPKPTLEGVFSICLWSLLRGFVLVFLFFLIALEPK